MTRVNDIKKTFVEHPRDLELFLKGRNDPVARQYAHRAFLPTGRLKWTG